MRLTKAKLPEWVDWILVAYVVFHVLTHLFLTVSKALSLTLFLPLLRVALSVHRAKIVENGVSVNDDLTIESPLKTSLLRIIAQFLETLFLVYYVVISV